MRRLRRRMTAVLTALLLLTLLIPWGLAEPAPGPHQTTVLFTHDLHSHFLPLERADGGESGGYARLASALEQQRALHPDALTLDGGDFSIGSLVQTLYTTRAAELRTMGALGYDATTAGNHEFDHTGLGFAQMLTAAYTSGDPLPALLMANYAPSAGGPDQLDIQRAMSAYGVTDTLLLERGGVTYGIFGLMGTDSDDCAPTSGFTLEDPVQAAQRCVDSLEEQGAQFIIALSHSGTDERERKSEDQQLAREVEGIDLILSGHTHTTLTQPIVEGDTYIVSAGPYCENLGSITLEWSEDGSKTLVDYQLIPIDQTLPEDQEIASLVEEWKAQVGVDYLARYHLTYDQVLARADFSLTRPESGVQQGNPLGELVADAFLWAARELAAEDPGVPTVAVTADGVLRADLPAGDITVSQAFDVLSMGVGEDGTSGFPLVTCYLTGKELRAAAEVDASVTPIMPAAQLYMSGMVYTFNPHRMFFNRVTSCWLEEPSFATGLLEREMSRIEDDQLYRVVTGMYSAQMLGTVKEKSLGLLSLEPKDENGVPITDFATRVLRDGNGSEIKEWYALAAYLQSFGDEGVPERYGMPKGDGRKSVDRSWNPIELLRSPNWITLVTLLAAAAVLAAAVLLVRALVRRVRRRRYGGGRKRYRGSDAGAGIRPSESRPRRQGPPVRRKECERTVSHRGQAEPDPGDRADLSGGTADRRQSQGGPVHHPAGGRGGGAYPPDHLQRPGRKGHCGLSEGGGHHLGPGPAAGGGLPPRLCGPPGHPHPRGGLPPGGGAGRRPGLCHRPSGGQGHEGGRGPGGPDRRLPLQGHRDPGGGDGTGGHRLVHMHGRRQLRLPRLCHRQAGGTDPGRGPV